MPKTTKFGPTAVGIPQHGSWWCIPASIENLLRSEDVRNITQEDLIYEYYSQRGLLEKPLNKWEQILFIAYLCDKPIPKASFQTFAPVTNALLSGMGISFQLHYEENIHSHSIYLSRIESILSSNRPVLISALVSHAWHITIVYEFDGEFLLSYNPGLDRYLRVSNSDYNFSHDLLYVLE